MSSTMDRAPSEKWTRDNMHRAKPNATTKKARDEMFRARQNAREQDKDRMTLKPILSCEV